MNYTRDIFVFGSNEAGIHGKGAAFDAAQYYDAEWGVGRGLTGDAYAIPTKDGNLRSLPLEVIEKNFEEFLNFTDEHPKWRFILTPIGSGLAGYTIKQIKEITVENFNIGDNVLFTSTWFKH